MNVGILRQRTAIDVGGTFTDVLTIGPDGVVHAAKVPTTPADLAVGFRAALAATAGGVDHDAPQELLYSTTLALNALLQHRLPRIGLIVTQGFRDLMETARLPVVDEAATSALPPRLVPLELVREISARTDADGVERVAVVADEVRAIAHEYHALGIEVVAVSLLHSYADQRHERAVGKMLAASAPALRVVLSCTVLPELREYERTVATCLNACLTPVLGAHLRALRASDNDQGDERPLWLMKSSGGLASADHAAARPLATALSGPSAAVVGMAWLGRRSGYADLITLDVGGTSTDVALVRDGCYALTTAGAIAGFPFKTPMVDVLSIGAGGGSLAQQGADTRWHVGPHSAGADPGPVCYGRGGRIPTLTDAHLVLGRLPAALLGGRLPLDADAARAALAGFGASRGLGAAATARGILEIATHNMCGAIRRVSIRRGYDPSAYALLAMGGAGPLHAAELAHLLGITTVIVPPQPGLAAALGLHVADIEEDFVRVCGMHAERCDSARVARDFTALATQAADYLDREAVPLAARDCRCLLDVRYAGMLGQLTIALAPGPVTATSIAGAVADFHQQFLALAGHDHRDREAVELINLRLRARGLRTKPVLPALAPVAPAAAAPARQRAVAFLNCAEAVAAAIHDRSALACAAVVVGPAVIEQFESTVLVPPAWAATVDEWANLVLCPAAPARAAGRI